MAGNFNDMASNMGNSSSAGGSLDLKTFQSTLNGITRQVIASESQVELIIKKLTEANNKLADSEKKTEKEIADCSLSRGFSLLLQIKLRKSYLFVPYMQNTKTRTLIHDN